MSFSKIIGHQAIVKILQSSLQAGRTAHAYLFIGPEGVGKQLVAKTLSKAIACEKRNFDACGTCPSCRKIDDGSYPNLTWLKPGGLSRRIGIDDIRELRHNISLKAYRAGTIKMFIITEADRMTVEAGNALLKTLEEPPDDSLLILLTSHSSSLLPTIISRCQIVRFSPLPVNDIKDYLISRLKTPSEEALLLSRLSEGRLGKAISLREKTAREERDKILDLISQPYTNMDLDKLLRGAEIIGDIITKFKKRLEEELKEDLISEKKETLNKKQLQEIKEERKALIEGKSKKKTQEILDTIISWYRDLLIIKEGSVLRPALRTMLCEATHSRGSNATQHESSFTTPVLRSTTKDEKDEGEKPQLINSDREEVIRETAAGISSEVISKHITLIEKIKYSLDHNVNLRLSLEAIMMKGALNAKNS